MTLEQRVEAWIRHRLGDDSMARRERSFRLLEEAIELAQADGIEDWRVASLMRHVYDRKVGESHQEAGGVAVCLLGWCAAAGTTLIRVAMRELIRIESKTAAQVQESLARKRSNGLLLEDYKKR